MKTAWISCLLALLMTLPLRAEQMKELGPWQVHYSAFNSSFLTPDVAKAYGLERSRYNGIINIAVQTEFPKKTHTYAKCHRKILRSHD